MRQTFNTNNFNIDTFANTTAPFGMDNAYIIVPRDCNEQAEQGHDYNQPRFTRTS